jgi:hypothetical protein
MELVEVVEKRAVVLLVPAEHPAEALEVHARDGGVVLLGQVPERDRPDGPVEVAMDLCETLLLQVGELLVAGPVTHSGKPPQAPAGMGGGGPAAAELRGIIRGSSGAQW